MNLRKDIIDRLKDVDNSNELRHLLHMVEQMILSPFDPNDVTPVQWRIFNDALEAVKRGNYITEEESNREIDSWKETSLDTTCTVRQAVYFSLLETTRSIRLL